MKRLALVTVMTMLALPGTAMARSGSGVVLSLDRAAHTAQVVDPAQNVHAYRFAGRLSALAPGSRIRFQVSGSTIYGVRAAASPRRTVSFYARVVRASARGLTLGLADGRLVSYSPVQLAGDPSLPAGQPVAHAARAESAVNLQGLDPGVTVLATLALAPRAGVSITLPGPGEPEQQALGVVSEVQQDALVLKLANRLQLRLHASAGALAGLHACERARVSYHQDAGMLVADSVRAAHRSAAPRCAERSAAGTITQLSASGVSIDTRGGRSLSFAAQATTLGGFAVGDIVDVTYTRGAQGRLNAGQVEYVEHRTAGTVSASGPGTVTITDAGTGRPVTFATDATIASGEHVVVIYHRSAGGLVAGVLYALSGGE